MVDCDFSNGGCNGGFLAPSLNYLIGEGLVSESCLPYKNEMSSSCAYQCDDKYKEYRKYSCKIGSLTILTSANEIKREILINGPMMVGFTVYDDFLGYSGGIYSPITTDVAGGHAVKIIGWDVDGSGDLYWICQNQWGAGWGD
jgi:cathepsin B